MELGSVVQVTPERMDARRALRRLQTARPTLPLPERLELGTFAKADGPWHVDWQRARRDARAVLEQIDFSRRDIVIWVPGTDGSGVHREFDAAMRRGYRGDGSLVALRYEASWDLRRSLPTGLATMKLVLEGIRARGGDHRVLLAGESQGAWIIGEAAADPRVGPVVDRAILVGHPWLAKTQYLDGRDPRVRVINHVGDQITMPVRGDAGVGMDAMTAVKTGRLGANLGTVARAILANPIHGVLLLHTQLRELQLLRPFLRDPHYYAADMPRMVEYLQTGVLEPTDEELREAGRARERR